jgi:hypothetical protein
MVQKSLSPSAFSSLKWMALCAIGYKDGDNNFVYKNSVNFINDLNLQGYIVVVISKAVISIRHLTWQGDPSRFVGIIVTCIEMTIVLE